MVTVQLGDKYIEELDHRMRKAKISQNALAAELGKTPSQISRWFTKNLERRVLPNLATAKLIEEAFAKLKARRERV